MRTCLDMSIDGLKKKKNNSLIRDRTIVTRSTVAFFFFSSPCTIHYSLRESFNNMWYIRVVITAPSRAVHGPLLHLFWTINEVYADDIRIPVRFGLRVFGRKQKKKLHNKNITLRNGRVLMPFDGRGRLFCRG